MPGRIRVVTSNFPSAAHPQRGAFVHTIVKEWARAGVETDVVAPRSIFEPRSAALDPPSWRNAEIPNVSVQRPTFLSFSNRILPGGFSTFRLTTRSFARAASRASRSLNARPAIVYAHFLYPSGAGGLRCAEAEGVPAVAALGESSLANYEAHFTRVEISRHVARFAGLLAVSEENARYAIERFGASESRILVLPNAADTTRFQPGDQADARRQLGLPPGRPIVAFTGHFIERKGPLRLLAALKNHPEIAAIFLGSGPDRPTGPQVLHAAPVPHEQLPQWLVAADLFVLPTLAEGCPNAVVEAMACGLPIVSSDIAALRETVGEGNGILVDPLDVSALSRAIATVLSDAGQRAQMSAAALARGTRLSAAARAERILDWMGDITPAMKRVQR